MLDVGCFTALDTSDWADRADALYGVDVDRAISTGHPAVKRAQASVAALPFPDGAFDVVTFSEVLEHLPADLERPAIGELRRVVADHGTLILTTPHKGWFAWLDPLDAKRRLRLRGGEGHKHYTIDDIERLLDGLFEIVELDRNSLILHPVSTWLGMGNQDRWIRLRGWMSDWDYQHQFGRASFNMALVARPI